MQLHNLKHPDEKVSFKQAVLRGLGRDNGLFFPNQFPRLSTQELTPEHTFQQRSSTVLNKLIGDEFESGVVEDMVRKAFTFAPELKSVAQGVDVLELFHGPTLAFKDYGARFLAQVLKHLIAAGEHSGPLTILSATSGDTGAAVAHAFTGIENVQVVILYPRGKISPLQEKMFCTLGGNIHTLAVDSDFDSCQSLVKAAFADSSFVQRYGLNSANSINVSRLFAQVCYYFEACALAQAKITGMRDSGLHIAVPSGNFGNVTAGMIAKAMGAPIARLIAATNSNDTVPRYLASGIWDVHATVATLSNAMDVSAPNNWPRSQELMHNAHLSATVVNEAETIASMMRLQHLGYIAEPHTAIAYEGLRRYLQDGESGIFLSTAHPAKFREAIAEQLGVNIALPPELQAVADKPILSRHIAPDLAHVKTAITAAW